MYRTILSVLLCNLIEWYDFILYGHLSYLFGNIFFPNSNEYISLLLTLSTFAVGFIARPVGAILFGYIGDKKGRKFSFIMSLMTMMISTAAFALLPTFKDIGIISPILLVIIRVVQGLSFGGESGGVVLMAESIKKKSKTTFICGFHPVSCVAGVVLGYFSVKMCESLMSELQFQTWGWRIPVVLGVIMTLFVSYLRKNMQESAEYLSCNIDNKTIHNPIVNIFSHYKKEFFISSGLYALSASSFYVFTIFLNILLITSPEKQDVSINLYSILMFIIAIMAIVSSYLASIFDRNKVLMLISLLFIIFIYPIFYFINLRFVSSYVTFAILVGMYLGPITSIATSLFPVRIRQTGVTLSYNLAGALLGGTAPAICVWITKTTGMQTAPAFYLIICAAISFTASYSVYYMNKSSVVKFAEV